MLNLLRGRQPISRAELARATGLQRSTISLIIEELIGDQWVTEGPRAPLPRGRRPTSLRLNDERVTIAVDVRPKVTMTALSDVNGNFSLADLFDTPPDAGVGIETLCRSVLQLKQKCGNRKIEGVGVSLPGRLNPDSTGLAFSPNLRWEGVDLQRALSEATGLDVQLENAANACVLAAVWFDRTPCRNLVVVTVSEGIGAGILANGQLVHGARGFAGEFGHVSIDPSGPECSCGSRGCWEVFGSNRAAVRYYNESGDACPDMNFEGLLHLAGEGDMRAAQALKRMAQGLGRGMRNIVAGLDPEQILVIGDLTRSWDCFAPIFEKELEAQVPSGGRMPRIIPVHEGGMARLRGTVALVFQRHFTPSGRGD